MHTTGKGVVGFLVLAFVPAWLLWELPLLLGVSPGSSLFQLAVVPGAFAPAIAALIVRKWITAEGFDDAGLAPNLDRWPYYLAAWLVPLAVVAFVVAAASTLGLGQPDYSLKGTPFQQGGLVGAAMLSSLYTVFATPVLWGEEFGWRGYLQLRLFPGRPLLAAIATGLIWGVWHFPLLATGVELPRHPYLIFALFPVGTVLYSIIFGWIRIRSGSVWASSFAHSAINNVGVGFLGLLFVAQSDRLALDLLGLVPLAAFALIIAATGGLKSRA